MIEVERIAYTPNPQGLIELAILQCTNNWEDIPDVIPNKTMRNRFEYVLSRHHLSVLEHVSVTFSIRGVSRSCSHQFVRHRLASYSQLSMRYADLSKLQAVMPESIASDDFARIHFKALTDASKEIYDKLLEQGIESEDARFILPIGFETQFVVTMNLRSWIHFLKERTYPKAQWEIRYVANKIYEQLNEIVPDIINEEFKKYWL